MRNSIGGGKIKKKRTKTFLNRVFIYTCISYLNQHTLFTNKIMTLRKQNSELF